MAHTTSNLPPARHIPANTSQGWPVAIAIIVLAIIVNTTVYMIHERTSSRSPIDPMFRAVGTSTTEAGGAAAGGHGEGQTGQGAHSLATPAPQH